MCLEVYLSVALHIFVVVTMSVPTNNKSSLRTALEKTKLSGTNFLDWSRTLRIVLKSERTEYVLSKKIPRKPKPEASLGDHDAYKKHRDDALDVQCLMLANMEPSLQIQFENVGAYTMYRRLERLFQREARNERYDTVCALMDCKLGNGQESSPHIIKMMGMIDRLAALGHPIKKELAVDIVLRSLPERFNQFVLNFNMHQFDKSLSELHGMITNVDRDLKKTAKTNTTPSVLLVQNKKPFKKKGVKGKAPAMPKPKPSYSTKRGASSDDKCHFCNGSGHWKRNCPKYLADKRNGAGTSGIDSVIGKMTHLHIV